MSSTDPVHAPPAWCPHRRCALARAACATLGFDVTLDEARWPATSALAATTTRAGGLAPRGRRRAVVAMATRGGYGLTRLLDRIDWPLLARSVEQGTRWVGHSDITALQLGLLAHTGAQLGRADGAAGRLRPQRRAGGVDEVTRDCFPKP
jgi:muramoyltetrapeptide carboxypeptidase